MSSCVADLDGILQSMLLLKAPGVTGSKIASITALCNENIQVRFDLGVILMPPCIAFFNHSN